MRGLVKDRRGEAVFLALLFLMWVAILFLSATSQISTAVAVRSQLARLCDEIAVNVAMRGLDRAALAEGHYVLDEQVAHAIAAEVFRRAGVEGVTFTIRIINDEIVVRATLGNILATGVARPRKLRN